MINAAARAVAEAAEADRKCVAEEMNGSAPLPSGAEVVTYLHRPDATTIAGPVRRLHANNHTGCVGLVT